MNKKYILWDHDGVLVNTEQWYFRANERALFKIGITITVEEYMHYMVTGTSVWTIASERGIPDKIIADQRKKRDRYYREFLKSENIEISCVIETLEKLKPRFAMAIVTTSKKGDFELIHSGRHIVDYMDFCLTIEDYKKAKPLPDPYIEAMKRFKAEPDECVVIEDSERGLRSALAAGIDCIIVKNDFTRSHDFTGAAYIVDKIEDILSILDF